MKSVKSGSADVFPHSSHEKKEHIKREDMLVKELASLYRDDNRFVPGKELLDFLDARTKG